MTHGATKAVLPAVAGSTAVAAVVTISAEGETSEVAAISVVETSAAAGISNPALAGEIGTRLSLEREPLMSGRETSDRQNNAETLYGSHRIPAIN